jgi:hypothetical protein
MRREDDPARLADDPGLDPWIGDLLRSTEPYAAPPGRKQRVLLGFGRRAARRTPRLLRPAIVLGILVGCGAFASAALGPWRGWIGRAYERLVAPTPIAAASRPRVHAAAAPRLALVTPPAPVALSPVAPPRTPIAIREPAAAPRARHVAPSAATPPQAETESQLVLEAMRALRLEKNPVRARALLARYLQRNPGGALAEEALALSIEAAVAHHDADAAALGARYLRRYPSGPFRPLALDAQR